MGYWNTSPSGDSFSTGHNPDGSAMLWGDAPADEIDGGVDSLITRLRLDLGRFPTVHEVDEARGDSPEIVFAIVRARDVFAKDVGREATTDEVAAGLAFSDTGIALDSRVRADIAAGDTIRFAVWRDNGGWQEVDHTAEGVVEGIAERERTSQWSGRPYTQVVYVVDTDGAKTEVDREYARKVLPGDKTVEEENALREQHRSKRLG